MTLKQMKNIDIRTVQPETLVELSDVFIDTELPVQERIQEYGRQIGNPYCFKCGDVAVKIGFADTNRTINDCMESYLSTI